MRTLARYSRRRPTSTVRSHEGTPSYGEETILMTTTKDAPGHESASSLPPRTQARGQARRREILATATSMFSARGFNKVSIGDIAKGVGISQAGILHYFPSKADLLLEVLKEREDKNEAARIEYTAGGDGPLEAHVRTLKDNDASPELVQLFVVLAAESAAPEHPGHEWFAERNGKLYRWMLATISEVIDETKLPGGVTVETVARWLVALPPGLGSKWVYETEAFDRAGTVELFIRMLRPYMKNDLSAS